MGSEFLIVARSVLKLTQCAMRPAELVDYALKNKMFSDRIAGKTPQQTMKSKLSVHVRQLGEHSEFVRTKPGHFHLRELLGEDEEVYQAKPQSRPNPRETVLVFPATLLERFGRFQGIRLHWKRVYGRLLKSSNSKYMNRLLAESNDAYKQGKAYGKRRHTGNGQLVHALTDEIGAVRGSDFDQECSGILNDLFMTEIAGAFKGTAHDLAEILNIDIAEFECNLQCHFSSPLA